jgi:hypothetical protein
MRPIGAEIMAIRLTISRVVNWSGILCAVEAAFQPRRLRGAPAADGC